MNHSYTNRQNELSMKDLFSKWEKFGNKCRVFFIFTKETSCFDQWYGHRICLFWISSLV